MIRGVPSIPPRSLPVRRAELLVRGRDGRSRRIRKVAGQAPAGNGVFPQFRLHDNRLVCVDGQGNPTSVLRLRDNEMPGTLLGDAAAKRAWFSTNRAVYALDPTTGAVVGQRELAGERDPKAMILHRGRAVLANDREVEWLDRDLGVTARLPVDEPIKRFLPLGADMLALEHYSRCGRLTIVSADGQEKQQFTQLTAPTVDETGCLYGIEGAAERSLLKFDPRDGALSRTPTSPRARAVAPRRDGSCLVLHDEGDRPALLLHRGDTAPRRYEFGARGYMRELLLTENDAAAYVMLDRYKNGNRKGQTVYRIDLDAPPTLAQRLGLTSPVRPVHSLTATSEAPRMAATAEGRLLLVDGQGATVVDPEAGDVRPVGTGREAIEEALRGSRLVTRSVSLGQGPTGAAVATLDAVLDRVPATQRDGCLDLPSEEVPLVPPAVTSGPRAGGIDMHPGKVVLRHDGRAANVFFPPQGTRFVAVTTAPADDGRPLVAAATSNGQVHCFDPAAGISSRPVAKFDVGAPIRRLATDPTGRIVAEAENGTLLFVEP